MAQRLVPEERAAAHAAAPQSGPDPVWAAAEPRSDLALVWAAAAQRCCWLPEQGEWPEEQARAWLAVLLCCREPEAEGCWEPEPE